MARTAKILKKFSFSVRGIKWSAQIFIPSEFYKLEGAAGADALSDEETRTIYLKTTELTQISLRHEVVHAYATSFHLTSADITGKQMEEVFAEWISRHIEEYISTCDRLWRKIDAWKNNRCLKTKYRKTVKKIKKTANGIRDVGGDGIGAEGKKGTQDFEKPLLSNPLHKKETT